MTRRTFFRSLFASVAVTAVKPWNWVAPAKWQFRTTGKGLFVSEYKYGMLTPNAMPKDLIFFVREKEVDVGMVMVSASDCGLPPGSCYAKPVIFKREV